VRLRQTPSTESVAFPLLFLEMSETVRTFIAIPIEASPSLRKVMRQLAGCGKGVRVVDPEHLHVTLKFLGDTPWTSIAQVGAILDEVVSQYEPAESQLQSLGAFPDGSRPRIVWTGMTATEPLGEIARLLNDRLGEFGFPREQRGFVPHVTLARIKSEPPAVLQELLSQYATTSFGGFLIDHVILYQSELGRGGPKYIPLSEHDLK
jgi:2'-5' RNA ligase